MATYAGIDIFGFSVSMVHVLNPTAEQLNAFFGLNGQQALWGGMRGRAFEVDGVLFGVSVAALNNAEALYHSYIDGRARVLVDTRGRSWSDVLVKQFQPQGRVRQDARGFYLPYKGLLVGLS
jgi:hypothetical protein